MRAATSWKIPGRAVTVWLVLAAANLFAALGPTNVVTMTGGWANHSGNPPFYGYQDGATNIASFNFPDGLALDASGNALFIADCTNNAVRWLSSGSVYTFINTNNGISRPVAVAVDSLTNVFVLNRANGTNGFLVEFNAAAFYSAIVNGLFDESSQPLGYWAVNVGTNAIGLTNVTAMAMDAADNLYITCNSNTVIRVSSANVLTTVGVITNAGVNLRGIALTTATKAALTDAGNNGVWMMNLGNGSATQLTGFHGAGDTNGPWQFASFNGLQNIAAAGNGWLIVADRYNNKVKTIDPLGNVRRLFGVSSNLWDYSISVGWKCPGLIDGLVNSTETNNPIPVEAREPFGIVVGPDGSVYDTEVYYHVIRHITSTGLPLLPPLAPTGLAATTNSIGTAIILTWSASTTATNYIVERSQSSGGPYTTIGTTTGTTYTDTYNLASGTTYYYVVVAVNSGGVSGNSVEASAIMPTPPPPPPNIGWYDYEINGLYFYSTMHPVSGINPYIANNPLQIAIDPTTNGVSTYYITVPPQLATNVPSVSNGSQPPVYENNQQGPPNINVNSLTGLTLSNGLVTIKAVNVNGLNESSSISSASFLFEVGNPIIAGNNAAQFTISDVTTNVIFYYTLDGSDPTNAPLNQQIASTNGSITLSLNGSTNIIFQVRGFGYGSTAGYLMSGVAQKSFVPGAYIPNTLSFGFANGEGSSSFVAAPGQVFYAPVTLTMLPGVSIYSLQFSISVTNAGVGITNPAQPSGPFDFQSMLMKPDPSNSGVFLVIPPYMFASYQTASLPASDYVPYEGTNFVNLVVSNGNQLAVGWLERRGATNLYNTKGQTLITYSLAHDDLFPPGPNNEEPNGVIVGGYSFQIADTNIGRQYQIQLTAASATSDGVGAPGSGVIIATPSATNGASLSGGTLNALKNVTIGSIPYLVGDVYNFRWFNAGDFGTRNLTLYGSANAEQVFQSAVYGLNTPPPNSDFFDAMDSAGGLGAPDNDSASPFYGYWTNSNIANFGATSVSNLFSGNITNINRMAFGDGQLDISDVYVTFLRAEFTNSFLWFERVWTNGQRVAIATNAGAIIPSGALSLSGSGKMISPALSPNSNSVTNAPLVNFAAADFLATAGQQISIPITATVFGPYALKATMLNITVQPLDGSPALTSPISFSTGALGSPSPGFVNSIGNNNFAAAWFPGNASISGSGIIGTLNVTIPPNATSQSAYAIHFDHASGSPNGFGSFPKHTLTGLITLSARTNSYYNDGIPDSWRLRYFGTVFNYLSVSNADADGTGMNNWQKYVAGLNPTDPTSKLFAGADQSAAQSQQDSVIYWPSVSGKTYIIQRSSDLFSPVWISVSTNIGTGGYMEIHDSPTNSFRYYRVQVQ